MASHCDDFGNMPALNYITYDENSCLDSERMYCIPVPIKSGDTTLSVYDSKTVRNKVGDFVRQPCKARGVVCKAGQNPHVARFAYIDIPAGTQHGTVLSCSHPICIESGRLFRYCAHCRTAVAKRNFNVRHAHGNLNSPPGLKTGNGVKSEDAYSEIADSLIPSVISIGDFKEPQMWLENGSSRLVSLTASELEIIELLRSRPVEGNVREMELWKDSILQVADNWYPNVSSNRFIVDECKGHLDTLSKDCLLDGKFSDSDNDCGDIDLDAYFLGE
jgi:hypothetical protein